LKKIKKGMPARTLPNNYEGSHLRDGKFHGNFYQIIINYS